MFSFPSLNKRSDLHAQWLKNIPRKDFTPSSTSVVCFNHFRSEDIITFDKYIDKNTGIEQILYRKKPTLKPDACPTIFPALPSYLNIKVPEKRTDPTIRAQQVIDRHDTQTNEWLAEDLITDFSTFQLGYFDQLKDQLKKQWTARSIENEYVLLYTVTIVPYYAPSIGVSVKILPDMSIVVYNGTTLVHKKSLQFVLNNNKLTNWSQIQNLLVYYSDETIVLDVHRNTLDGIIEQACTQLHLATELEDTKSMECKNIIVFLIEQLHLLMTKSRKKIYSNSTLCFAFMLHIKSPSCYRYLRQSKLLCLPHPRTLRKLMAPFSVSTDIEKGSDYLHVKCRALSERERIVAIQMDEIYVKSLLSYSGGQIVGTTTNSTESATTVQAFLISSVFGSYSEVVGLVPMKKMKFEDLQTNLLKAIKCVQECGFIVLAVISDNNSVNRKVYKSLLTPGEYSFQVPPFPNKPIFLLHDSVHLLKSIWHNWLNKKTVDQSFSYPSLKNGLNVDASTPAVQASFSHLRNLYSEEKAKVAKLTPTLTYKSLFPTSMERQNVPNALGVFSEYNVAALRFKEDEKLTYTADFIEVILKWWHIVNVKGILIGKKTRNVFSDPIRSIESHNLNYLKQLKRWLETWKSYPDSQGKLSSETSYALQHTVTAVIKLIEFSLEFLPVQYILLGKLQTDNLEAKFGEYRQLSGSNYLVSVKEILESEKKLRVHSVLCMSSSKYGDVHIKDLTEELMSSSNDSLALQQDQEMLSFDIDSMDTDVFVPAETEDALIYIAGYVAHKLTSGVACQTCISLFQHDKPLQADTEPYLPWLKYTQLLDRGGLKYPSFILAEVAFLCFTISQKLISTDYETKFLKCKNQKKILIDIATSSLQKHNSFVAFSACECGADIKALLLRALPVFTNIFLNNYRKMKNDKQSSCPRRKIAKFMPK
jgi:hypothetical protein